MMVHSPLISPNARKIMQGNRGRDTSIEKDLRGKIHKLRRRYAIGRRREPEFNRGADFVSLSVKASVFVNGYFWHGCLKHFKNPRRKNSFDKKSIARNFAREKENRNLSHRRGECFFDIWEHNHFDMAADRIVTSVQEQRLARING